MAARPLLRMAIDLQDASIENIAKELEKQVSYLPQYTSPCKCNHISPRTVCDDDWYKENEILALIQSSRAIIQDNIPLTPYAIKQMCKPTPRLIRAIRKIQQRGIKNTRSLLCTIVLLAMEAGKINRPPFIGITT